MAHIEFGFAPIDLSEHSPFIAWFDRLGAFDDWDIGSYGSDFIEEFGHDPSDGSGVRATFNGRFSYQSYQAFLNSPITEFHMEDSDGSFSVTITGKWTANYFEPDRTFADLRGSSSEVVGSALGDTLEGSDGAKDTLLGNGGDDMLRGLGGDDSLLGSDGNDTLDGGDGTDIGDGGAGDDEVIVRFGEPGRGDSWNGGAGVDTLVFELTSGDFLDRNRLAEVGRLAEHIADPLLVDQPFTSKPLALTAVDFEDYRISYAPSGQSIPIETLLTDLGGIGTVTEGTGGHDVLVGSGGNDLILPSDGDDHLVGGSGADALLAGVGEDVLYGGARADVLEGGADADVFRFGDWLHSRPGAEDLILDFEQGIDRIDVTGVDAIQLGRNDDFVFIGSGEFSAAGQLRAVQAGNDVRIEGETTGDGEADFAIIVQGAIAADFTADDFYGLV